MQPPDSKGTYLRYDPHIRSVDYGLLDVKLPPLVLQWGFCYATHTSRDCPIPLRPRSPLRVRPPQAG